jgi:hypothetical protein
LSMRHPDADLNLPHVPTSAVITGAAAWRSMLWGPE